MIQLKTMAMKARVANFIRKELYKARLDQISKERKIELFDQIFQMNHAMHYELLAYKNKRKEKAYIHAERIKRGKLPKKKVSLEQHKINLDSVK